MKQSDWTIDFLPATNPLSRYAAALFSHSWDAALPFPAFHLLFPLTTFLSPLFRSLPAGSTVSSVSSDAQPLAASAASESHAAWASSFGAITMAASDGADSSEAHRELEDSTAAADAVADVAAGSSNSAVGPVRPAGMWLGMLGGSGPQGMGCRHSRGGFSRRYRMGQQQAEEGVTTMYVAGDEGEDAGGEEECSSKCWLLLISVLSPSWQT